MKTLFLFILLVPTLLITSCRASFQKTYQNQPLITAKQEVIDYRVGNQWYRNQWSIAPEIENDTLVVICYEPQTDFLFQTDQDSISLRVSPGSIHHFYVLLADSAYAHTVVQGVPFATQSLQFDDNRTPGLTVSYQSGETSYLQQLREQYPIVLSAPAGSDQEKVLAVLNWTNSRWQHNGNNAPKKNDAISILQEAEAGGQFPCFAYAIVLRDQLTSLGYKARTIYLKSRDAATSNYPPGHVATEVYLDDLQKWAFLDGQFNVMPTLNGTPLNAVEFQDAVTHHYREFELTTIG
ncbi:MAG: hypothetical protein KDD15_31280, partial [Lewinella sp.]|nr:hypothetical protein [Lewinella sp.]